MDTIKSKTLSSYLDNDITERLGLSEPIEPDQSGSSFGTLLSLAAGEQVTTSITEEQSSVSSARSKKGKRLLIEDDEEEERGSHHQSSVQPESFKEDEESKELKTGKPKVEENSSQSESQSTATEEKKE